MVFTFRYRVTELKDGKPVRVLKPQKLVDRDDKYHSCTCKAVANKQKEFMRDVNLRSGASQSPDMLVAEFWEQTYLPHLNLTKKPSTLNGQAEEPLRRCLSNGQETLSQRNTY